MLSDTLLLHTARTVGYGIYMHVIWNIVLAECGVEEARGMERAPLIAFVAPKQSRPRQSPEPRLPQYPKLVPSVINAKRISTSCETASPRPPKK